MRAEWVQEGLRMLQTAVGISYTQEHLPLNLPEVHRLYPVLLFLGSYGGWRPDSRAAYKAGHKFPYG